MFGMTSEEFWEDDPQLYWSYRISFMKKLEMEQQQQTEYIKYNSWLNGNMNFIAHSTSLGNAFSKGKKNDFPAYEKVFKKEEKKTIKKLTKKEINNKVQYEYNNWARF
jgi:hypothetical protein